MPGNTQRGQEILLFFTRTCLAAILFAGDFLLSLATYINLVKTKHRWVTESTTMHVSSNSDLK